VICPAWVNKWMCRTRARRISILKFVIFQPSLRDLGLFGGGPGVETPGYFQKSLQDRQKNEKCGARRCILERPRSLQIPLRDDLKQAAVEQGAYWFSIVIMPLRWSFVGGDRLLTSAASKWPQAIRASVYVAARERISLCGVSFLSRPCGTVGNFPALPGNELPGNSRPSLRDDDGVWRRRSAERNGPGCFSAARGATGYYHTQGKARKPERPIYPGVPRAARAAAG